MCYKLIVILSRLFNLGNQDDRLLEPICRLEEVIRLELEGHLPVRVF